MEGLLRDGYAVEGHGVAGEGLGAREERGRELVRVEADEVAREEAGKKLLVRG